MTFLLYYLAAMAVFAVTDFVWLSFVANKLYRQHIGSLLLDKFVASAAVAFYLVFIFGLVIFALQPAISGGTLQGAVWRGALFGLVCYATYDLTNLATLKQWSLTLSLIDMAWGMILSSIVTSVCYLIFAH